MTTIARRSFLATLGAGLAAPAILRAQSRSKRYPIAFSTLGCPAWSWKTILENADRLGYAGIELRGIAGEMDLPKVPELQGTRLAGDEEGPRRAGHRRQRPRAPRRGCTRRTRPTREKQFDEGRRFIDLAQAMGVKYVRMFGDKIPEGEPKEEVMKRVVEGFQQMADVREARRRHGAHRVARRLHALGRPRGHPDPRRLAAVRPPLGRAPLLRGRRRSSRRTPTRSSASGSATRTSRTRSPREPTGATSSSAPARCRSRSRSRCWPGPATRASTASSGRRSGTPRSRSPRSRSRTTRRRWREYLAEAGVKPS